MNSVQFMVLEYTKWTLKTIEVREKKAMAVTVWIQNQYQQWVFWFECDLFFLAKELNVLSRKRLAPCISHIKPSAVGTSSGVKYGCQLHRNMQMWAYTLQGKKGGRWWWFISRVFQLVLVDVNCSPSIFHLHPSFWLFSFLISVSL